MSVQALSWVFDHSPTQGTDRLVLLAIANHAGSEPVDGAWEAWPGIERIRVLAGLERRRTVNDALTRLVAAGALAREINAAPDTRIPGDRRPNLYRILVAHGMPSDVTPSEGDGVTSQARRGDAGTYDGVTRGDLTGCRDASPEPSVEPSLEPSVEPGADFAAFWAAYPRATARRAAEQAWPKAVRRAGGDGGIIVAGARRYAADPNREDQFTAHAATWLNGDRWKDDPLPARTAGRPSKVDEKWAVLRGALDSPPDQRAIGGGR